MNLVEIREKIMTEDEFILSELNTIVSYYELKHTIRWSHKRDQDETESVAEHVYGMHILVDYFLPILKEEGLDLDESYIAKLVNWHDMAEAFVGDMTTRTKTTEHKQKELASEEMITNTGPEHLRPTLIQLFEDYNNQTTIQAKFVKAIDKIEPQVHLFFLLQKTKTWQNIFTWAGVQKNTENIVGHMLKHFLSSSALTISYTSTLVLLNFTGRHKSSIAKSTICYYCGNEYNA